MTSPNKLLLEGQLMEKQQKILKSMQFATQYMLKMTEYRMLNPLHTETNNIELINRANDLMNELSNYSQPNQNTSVIKKSQIKLSSHKKSPPKPHIKKQQFQEAEFKLQKTRLDKIHTSKEKDKYTQASSNKQKSPLKSSKYKMSSSNANMNTNRLMLQGQILYRQQKCLKGMQFATQYMLKQAQYRNLNPFHNENAIYEHINEKNKLMAELNSFCFPKKQIVFSNKFSTKRTAASKEKPKEKVMIQQNLQAQVKQPLRPYLSDEQVIKRIQLLQQDEKSVFKQIQSQFSDSQSSKSSVMSVKSRSKFEKISKPNTQNISSGLFPGQFFNFKKKKVSDSKSRPIQQSVILKKQHKQQLNESDDSFQNFPFADSQENEEKLQQKEDSLHSSDFESYISSVNGDRVKFQMKVVSEHPSQYQASFISKADKRQNANSVIRMKRNQELISKQQSGSTKNARSQLYVRKNMAQKQLDQQGISNYLMQLQSFQVQQQILMKKVVRIWNKQLDCINKLKKMTWSDLQLPKPTYKSDLFQYARIIE